MQQFMDGSPDGGTPLCAHINAIIKDVEAIEAQLRAANQKVCVVIATDGESSDGDISAVMRPLKNLPVIIVMRLCTNEERIVNYWNSIDQELELSMDVLDDICGEAEEIHKVNKWLTYAEPIHRMREFGISLKEFDLLDEKALHMEQMVKVCKTM